LFKFDSLLNEDDIRYVHGPVLFGKKQWPRLSNVCDEGVSLMVELSFAWRKVAHSMNHQFQLEFHLVGQPQPVFIKSDTV